MSMCHFSGVNDQEVKLPLGTDPSISESSWLMVWLA